MAPTILIKFCGLIVHSKPNNVILANFLGKIPETGKIFLNFFSVSYRRAKINSSISFKLDIYDPLANISSYYFCFRPTLKIKGSSHRKNL